jgi:uroporphyrinogen III methyltransferase/synthase
MKAQKLDIRALKDAKICAIGPKTAEELEERGLLVDVMPEVFRAEAVIEAMKDKIQPGDKVLLPRADLARQVLVDSLIQLGAEVNEVIAYQTVMADETDTQLLLEKLQDKEIHVLTFTSSSTVTNFLTLIGENRELIEGITIACIGPITAETAEKNGLKVDICAEKYTIDGLVEAIQNYFTK